MNDRFKFRAWYYDKDDENDSDNNKMFYDAQNTYDCLGGNPPLKASSFGDIIDDERWVVEQCTGLKDKNGKLIYEGDILKITDQMIDYIVEVKWNEGMFCYEITPNSANLVFFDLTDNETTVEVIGNEHENADLLENEE
jgi:uncharacterized phage protein (TIGR01671 family)